MELVPTASTGPGVYVTTMTNAIYDSYDALEETLNHTNILKIKSHTGENVKYCCDKILVYVE